MPVLGVSLSQGSRSVSIMRSPLFRPSAWNACLNIIIQDVPSEGSFMLEIRIGSNNNPISIPLLTISVNSVPVSWYIDVDFKSVAHEFEILGFSQSEMKYQFLIVAVPKPYDWLNVASITYTMAACNELHNTQFTNEIDKSVYGEPLQYVRMESKKKEINLISEVTKILRIPNRTTDTTFINSGIVRQIVMFTCILVQ